MTIRILTARVAASALLLLAGGAGPATAATNTVTFGTEGEYPIVIPAGVTRVQVVAIGGKGGTGNYSVEGGFGARVSATLPVTGGATRYVVVAGNGLDGSPRAGAGSGGGASRRNGGAVGGGGAGMPAGTGAGGHGDPARWSEDGQPGQPGVGGNGGLAGTLGFPSRDQQASGGYNGGGWAGGGFVNYRPGGWETFYGGGGGGGGFHGGGGGGGIVMESTNDSGGGGGGGSSLVPTGGTVTTDTTGVPSVTVSFEDAVAPVVGLDAPPAATRGGITVEGTAGTVLGDAAVSVDVYAGPTASGAPVASRTVTHDARSGAYQASFAALPEGQYSVRATQVDGAGNVGTTAPRTFTIDTTVPGVDPPGGGDAGGPGTNPPGGGGPGADARAPLLSRVALSARRFRVGAARSRVTAKLPRGTTLRFTLSEAATVTITISRSGRRGAASALTRRGATGANRVALTGRVGRKALPAGRYVLSLRAIDAAGNRGAAKTVSFRIG